MELRKEAKKYSGKITQNEFEEMILASEENIKSNDFIGTYYWLGAHQYRVSIDGRTYVLMKDGWRGCESPINIDGSINSVIHFM